MLVTIVPLKLREITVALLICDPTSTDIDKEIDTRHWFPKNQDTDMKGLDKYF